MANEATVNSSLSVVRGNLHYQSQPSAFRADVATTRGAAPGGVTINTTGVDIDFGSLVGPSLCRIMHVGTTGIVEYGKKAGGTFYPLGEMLAGETYVLRLSRNLEASSQTFHFKASAATIEVLIEAFEL
jgi:hypothetical protein